MTDSNARQATYEDIQSAPRDKVGELLGGVLHLSPRNTNPENTIAATLNGILKRTVASGEVPGSGWLILPSVEIRLGQDVVVPDLVGWRRNTLLTAPEITGAPPINGVPAWACEVITPRSVRLDRVAKRAAYARAQVQFLWYIDADLRTLETLECVAGRYVDAAAYSEDDHARVTPFDALELEIAALFANLDD